MGAETREACDEFVQEVVGECWRCGTVRLSPWWKHVNAVADPTHLRLLDTQTVKGICSSPGRPV
jgi:hypothetical protein